MAIHRVSCTRKGAVTRPKGGPLNVVRVLVEYSFHDHDESGELEVFCQNPNDSNDLANAVSSAMVAKFPGLTHHKIGIYGF